MRRLGPIFALLLALALAAPLIACGKKGSLDPPPDKDKTEYPRQYPR